MNDLEIIKRLGDIIGKKLKAMKIENVFRAENGYSLENKKIIGLNLNNLKLSLIPDLLMELKDLTHVNFGRNQIKDISALKDLKNLTMLNLYNNQITDILALKDLKKLTGLYLGDNQITDISALKDLKNLAELWLNRNQISDISSLKELKKMTELNLCGNQISQLPSWILELGLDIEWKLIGKGILLEGNPLEIPPVEIVKKGKEAISTWFKSLEGEKKALNEVKMLLVGDGGAGKTSLVKQLLKKRYDKNEPETYGININHWEIENNKDIIKVNIWDFGGQVIMHATHQFFMSKRSLYVLVLDVRKDQDAEYWLKYIESLGGDSPIMVVINKIDENPGFEINRPFLCEKYPNIKGFYRVSCFTGDGIDNFSHNLVKELAKVELIGTTWGKNWFKVKTRLEQMKKNKKDFISYDEYKCICQEENIYETEGQDTLVGFLNDLGVILCFKDFKLRQTHVLEPEWVTTAVYKIINAKELAKARGLLKLTLLDEILKKKGRNDFYYPPEKYRFIIELMQKFELCYEIDSETILVPDLLEVQQPVFNFDYAKALKFQVDYDFLPRSVMPRFIVKMHRDIKNGLHWLTGVVLEDQSSGCTAVVKSDVKAGKIYIFVQGGQKRDYFAVIRYFIKAINSSFEKIKAREMILCNCQECNKSEKTQLYDYTTLVKFRQKGKKEIPCYLSAENVSIDKLLDGIEKTSENREEEILQILKNLKEKFDTKETLLKKANEIITVNPNFMGFGININELIKKLFKK